MAGQRDTPFYEVISTKKKQHKTGKKE